MSRPSEHRAAARRPWDARASAALAVLVAGCLLSLPFLVHPWFEAGDETNDASIYIASARALLAGEGYSYLGEPFTVRPPGMSALIAAILAWRGADFLALNLLVASFGAACVALLFVHARERLGLPLAFLVAAAVWLSTPFQQLCNQVMSDVPGTALLLACLCIERWADRRPSLLRDSLLGACIGAATYVRSVTLLLMPAIVAVRIVRRWLGRGDPQAEPWPRFLLLRVLPVVALTLLVKLPWDLHSAAHHPVPPVDQNFLFSYSTAMWHVDGGDPASAPRAWSEILGRPPGRLVQVLSLLGSRMGTSASGAHAALGAVVLALALVTLVRRRESAELFALMVLGVLLVYFGFRDRLVLPLWILLLPAAVEGFLWCCERLGRARMARAAAALLLVALPILDFRPRAGWDRIEAAHQFYARYAEQVAAAVDPGVRIAAPIGWHLAVFLDRPVWSLFFGQRRAGMEEGTRAVLARHGIGAIVLSPRIESDRRALPWYEARFGPATVRSDCVVLRVPR